MRYMHDSNLTNPEPNSNPNRNPLTLTVTLVRFDSYTFFYCPQSF